MSSATVEGLGNAPAQPIRTLPPIPATHRGVVLSPRTGEPHRPALLGVAYAFAYLSAALAAAGFGWAWWHAIHMETWMTSTRFIDWMQPSPGSGLSLLAAVILAAICAVTVAAPWVAAYVAWAGRRWARYAGLIAVGISCLTLLMRPYAWVAIPPAAVAALLYWLPPVGKYFRQWEIVTAKPTAIALDQGRVRYGRMDRYRPPTASGSQPTP
ncbi:MAG: hypothetical protein LBH11_00925 [Propionibacteriaceae bacterium]|jgi:hypothetical protein|nr:hypothetical protein [Propionibacteriaceae bacterium]